MITPSSAVQSAARALYQSQHQGILSTHSVELEGFPFGSVITYAPDRNGNPILMMSDIAEHTANLRHNPRLSLIATEGGDDIQASARITLVGNAVAVGNEELADVQERFFARFEQARGYVKARDFFFFRLLPMKIRYIGGFGKIHWLEPGAVCTPNPFDAAAERAMCEHMNSDHVDTVQRFFAECSGEKGTVSGARVSAIDGEGFDMVRGNRFCRMAFAAPVSNANEVRMAMIALSRLYTEAGVAA